MPFINYQSIREINAFDYLVQYEGFSISNKSNKSWAVSGAATGSAVIEHPTTGAKFLVKKDAISSNEFRITATDGSSIPTGRGNASTVDLISFVAWLHSSSFPDAASTIAQKIPTLAVPVFSQHAIKPKPVDQTNLTQKVLANIKPLTNTNYLERRHLSKEVIHDDILFGRMGLYKTNTYDNFCFHSYNAKDNFVTTCQRYFIDDKVMKLFPSFKNNETGINHSPSTANTIFRTNMPECENPILLFSESPEDALSYYQLNYAELKDKTFIASSMGTFRNDQAVLLSAICKENQILKIILVNDNDAMGVNFDIMALCAIIPSTNSVTAPFLKGSCNTLKVAETGADIEIVGKKKLQFNFEFSDKQLDYANRLYEMLDKYIFLNKNRTIENNKFTNDSKTGNATIKFDCKNDKLHLEDIFYVLVKADKTNYFKEHFLIDKPYDVIKKNEFKKSEMKDWNELLKHSENKEVVFNKKLDLFLNEFGDDKKIEKKKGMMM